MWWEVLVGVVVALVLIWLGLAIALWLTRPDSERIGEALRLLPDVLRLLARLARDKSVPRGVRVRLWLVVLYLAMLTGPR